MTLDEAIAIVSQACGSVIANFDTHQKIQEALQTLIDTAAKADQ